MIRSARWTVLIIVLFAVVALASIGSADSVVVPAHDSGLDAGLLAEHRIASTEQGVKGFLQQLKTELAEIKKAEDLVLKLGDEKFQVRERAIQQLIEGPSLPLKALQQAIAAGDPEVASRAKGILNHPKVAAKVARAENLPWISAAVFRTIQAKGIQGVTPELFDVVALLGDPDSVDAAVEAIAETAGQDDAELLGRGLASKDSNLRIAAIRGSSRVDLKPEPELRALLRDADPRLALAAGHTLAQRNDRLALAVLVRLVSSADERVRARSEQILRAWAGRDFGFNPFQDPAEQKESLARWRDWFAANGDTAPLNPTLRLQPLPENLLRGLLLHYAFEQTAGARLIDSSGHKRHGTLHNEHSLVAGIAGKGLEVRGVGEMGDRGGHASLPFIDFTALPQFTVALWVHERAMTDQHGEAYVVFGADRTVVLEDSLGIGHFNNSIVYRIGGAILQIPFEPTDRNRWVHYVLTFQNGRLSGYKDGRLAGEIKGKVEVVGRQAALGRHWWHHGAGTSTRFVGAFDELRIYQRALAPYQVKLLASSQAPKTP